MSRIVEIKGAYHSLVIGDSEMKPIEEGCRAIIINLPKSRGSVTVLKFLGKVKPFSGDDRWAVDRKINKEHGFPPEAHIREKWLMRIDGYDNKAESESKEKELVNVQ